MGEGLEEQEGILVPMAGWVTMAGGMVCGLEKEARFPGEAPPGSARLFRPITEPAAIYGKEGAAAMEIILLAEGATDTMAAEGALPREVSPTIGKMRVAEVAVAVIAPEGQKFSI